MTRLTRRLRARRNTRELNRAIDRATTPMREELLTIAARIDR